MFDADFHTVKSTGNTIKVGGQTKDIYNVFYTDSDTPVFSGSGGIQVYLDPNNNRYKRVPPNFMVEQLKKEKSETSKTQDAFVQDKENPTVILDGKEYRLYYFKNTPNNKMIRKDGQWQPFKIKAETNATITTGGGEA